MKFIDIAVGAFAVALILFPLRRHLRKKRAGGHFCPPCGGCRGCSAKGVAKEKREPCD